MDFGTYQLYVNDDSRMQGVFKISTVRNFDQFLISLELFKLTSNDMHILQTVYNACLENPFKPGLIDKFDNQTVGTAHLNYQEVQKYLPIFRDQLTNLYNKDSSGNTKYTFPIGNKINVVLTIRQAGEIYNILNSFYQNYFVLESAFKISMYSKDANKSNNSSLETIKKEKQQNNKVFNEEQKINTSPLSTLDNILYFSCINVLKTSAIHMIFIYYKYLTQESIKYSISENETCVKLAPLFPKRYMFSTEYYKSIIMALTNIPIENLKIYMDKIVYAIISDEKIRENPIYIMTCCYLLFSYFMRNMYETHPSHFKKFFDKIITNPQAQLNMLNGSIGYYVQQFKGKIVFELNNTPLDNDVADKEIIEKISNEYKHLIPVSEQEFIDRVFKKLNDNISKKLPVDFNLSSKKVIDINNLAKSNMITNSKQLIWNVNSMFDHYNALEPVLNDSIIESNLLDYYFDQNKVPISKIYAALINYVKDPSSILSVGNEVPLTIKNHFQCFKDILNESNFHKEDTKTLNYYKILVDKLPNAELLSHTTILLMVFQIIIPYYVDVYNIRQFVDQLL